jgi:lipopolysaccharide O-acetyltransferase
MIAKTFGVKKINIGPHATMLGLSCIEMGEDFCAGSGLCLHAVVEYNRQLFSPKIVIGDHVHVSQWVHIAATNLVHIGHNVLIGSKVIITDHNHGQYSRLHSSPEIPPASRPLDRDRSVVIGNNVWLGDGVVVAPGAVIGDGSVIGPNSVVRGEIPPACIATGIPARVAKTFDFRSQKWVSVESFVSGCSEIEQR